MNSISTRNDMFSALPKGMVIAELGVFTGKFSEVILNACAPKELHLVDIWQGLMSSSDQDGNVVIPEMRVVYEDLMRKYAGHPVVRLHRKTAQEMLAEFPDSYFDLIYEDADHSYDSCYANLQTAFAKSKRYIAGHDYCQRFQGVMDAVSQFCKERNLSIEIVTKDDPPSFLIDKLHFKGNSMVKSAFQTLEKYKHLLKGIQGSHGPCVLEIGSDRFEGSTAFFADICRQQNVPFYSVDCEPQAHDRAKAVEGVHAFLKTGEDFIRDVLPGLGVKFSFVFLDNFDFLPFTYEGLRITYEKHISLKLS
jgi:hypothetical protein